MLLNDFVIVSAYLFLGVASEAAAFVVAFNVVLVILDALGDLLANLKQKGGD